MSFMEPSDRMPQPGRTGFGLKSSGGMSAPLKLKGDGLMSSMRPRNMVLHRLIKLCGEVGRETEIMVAATWADDSSLATDALGVRHFETLRARSPLKPTARVPATGADD